VKLYETLPDRVTVGRKTYRVNLDFRNVLRMMDVLDREGLLPEAATWLALKCVMRHVPAKCAEIMKAVNELCFSASGKKQKPQGPRLTSYSQDAGGMRAAFLQVYGIDLWTAKLHWLTFRDLMEGLPSEGTRYAEIISIRGRPMPKPTKWNADERKWLQEAKKAYAIDMTEAETESKYQQDVLNIFNGLMGMIPKG
jgi:hypothetical protein